MSKQSLRVDFLGSLGWCVLRGKVIVAAKYWTRPAAVAAMKDIELMDTSHP
jgi:hypothetical protein